MYILPNVDTHILSASLYTGARSCAPVLLNLERLLSSSVTVRVPDFKVTLYARIKKNTAYAKAQGVYTLKDGTGEWWLRSPAPDPLVFDKSNMTVRGVTSTGLVDSYINANYSYRGIVPALRVKL